ncbi:MAG: Transcription antitermination protein nusG [Parcubacteria group bacterium GW2011_GWC1_45_9]|nr:MAG: Transcription antitermination protein nusG [Parcubacteria group bacterium GW2011_GWA1_Parcubacteria_45_10]KKT89172.1 MAG: Transcription antitermination protein nusG [Parcubacteria group bacterium GW2011_GWB1_45_10]KKU17367.1 MAG: Transcription antitermination protein nusG [Parcubacteria group bacterium GW2011_GWC1_45_9]HCI05710.1 transcription termination/antitermination protein NusG [Patescibacteria group bacterium]
MAKQQLTQERNWYVIHTYSGYEEAVARSLKQRVESLNMADKVFNVLVPKLEKVKIRGGKKTTVEERLFPGYVFVEMIVTDESWYVVRNTPQVTGFVGSGITPIPVDKKEMENILKQLETGEPQYVMDAEIGDLVRIVDGPFKEMEGKLNEVDHERGKVKVMVNFLGRETPVELDFLQIKKI